MSKKKDEEHQYFSKQIVKRRNMVDDLLQDLKIKHQKQDQQDLTIEILSNMQPISIKREYDRAQKRLIDQKQNPIDLDYFQRNNEIYEQDRGYNWALLENFDEQHQQKLINYEEWELRRIDKIDSLAEKIAKDEQLTAKENDLKHQMNSLQRTGKLVCQGVSDAQSVVQQDVKKIINLQVQSKIIRDLTSLQIVINAAQKEVRESNLSEDYKHEQTVKKPQKPKFSLRTVNEQKTKQTFSQDTLELLPSIDQNNKFNQLESPYFENFGGPGMGEQSVLSNNHINNVSSSVGNQSLFATLSKPNFQIKNNVLKSSDPVLQHFTLNQNQNIAHLSTGHQKQVDQSINHSNSVSSQNILLPSERGQQINDQLQNSRESSIKKPSKFNQNIHFFPQSQQSTQSPYFDFNSDEKKERRNKLPSFLEPMKNLVVKTLNNEHESQESYQDINLMSNSIGMLTLHQNMVENISICPFKLQQDARYSIIPSYTAISDINQMDKQISMKDQSMQSTAYLNQLFEIDDAQSYLMDNFQKIQL